MVSRRWSPASPISTGAAASTCAPTTRPWPSTPPPATVEVLDQTHRGHDRASATTELLIATGGQPIRPDLPGIDLPFVHGVQTLDDAQGLLSLASRAAGASSSSGAATSGWRWPRRTSSEAARRPSSSGPPNSSASLDADLGAADRRGPARPRRRGALQTDVNGFEPRRGADLRRSDRRRPRRAGHRRRAPLGARRGGRDRARGQRRRPRRRSPGHDGRRRVVGGRLRRVHAPGQRCSRCTSPSAPTPTDTAGWPGSTWPAATSARPPCSASAMTKLCELEIALTGLGERRGARGRVRRRGRHDRYDDDAGYLPCADADDGPHRRRAGHGSVARRPRSSAVRAPPSASTRWPPRSPPA